MPGNPKIDYFQRQFTFDPAGELHSITFRRQGFDSQSAEWTAYLGIDVDQKFDDFAIDNQTKGQIAFSIEDDKSDSITVDLTGQDGVTTLESGKSVSLDDSQINRVRIYGKSVGYCQIILHRHGV